MTAENWSDTIPDDAECDTCGHWYARHRSVCLDDECLADDGMRCKTFEKPYPPDRSNWPTSRAEAEMP